MNPSPETYDRAVQILARNMRPLRAAELYRLSFVSTPGHEKPGLAREDERFRERLAQRRPAVIKRGPWFALERWIVPVLPGITSDDFVTLELNRDCVKEATWECIQRIEHMVVRNPQASKQTRYEAAISGLIVEHHVKRYFQTTWPTHYRQASNEGIWEKAAPDDFALFIGGRRWQVDVASADEIDPPQWRIVRGKMLGAHLRIIAYYGETCVKMLGYQWSTDRISRLRPLERLIVRLNIQNMPSCLRFFRDCIP
jgi:hypothetical protein